MKKRGFTLIELLAVIVILAIIALIATPIVMDTIESAKKGTIKESANNLIGAAELYLISTPQKYGKLSVLDENLDYDGKKPEKGEVEINSAGISRIYAYIDGYCATKDYSGEVVYVSKTTNEECDWYGTDNYEIVSDNNFTNKEVVSYKIYGNTSVSAGTPSPDSPVTITSLGESNSLSLKVSGANIFDGELKIGDYGTAKTDRITTINYIEVEPNTTYIFSRPNERVYFLDQEKTLLTPPSKDTGNAGNTVTTPANTKYIMCTFFGTTNVNEVIYINKGTTLIEEAYQIPQAVTLNLTGHDPLRCVGNVCDYIDFDRQEIVRQVGVQELNGNEDNWSYISGTAPYYDLNLNTSVIKATTGFSTHFENKDIQGSSNTYNAFRIITDSNNKDHIRISYPAKADLTSFKSWLSSNPLTIYYELKNPVYGESIETPSFPNLEGVSQNFYVNDSTISSNKIEVVVKNN